MDDVVVDACCLINLCAAGELRERLSMLGGEWRIPTAVLSEALYLHVERDDGTIEKVAVDLQSFVDESILLPCEAKPGDELDLYVELATRLDDGEAIALAIAKTRSWTLSTDDRKAKRIAGDLGVNVITTPEIMKKWSDLASPNADDLSEDLKRIERCASFFPAASDPLHSWWRDSMIE